MALVSRTPFVGGNWKMNLTHVRAVELASAIDAINSALGNRAVDWAVFPPFVHLCAVAATLGERSHVGAQDCSAHPDGAFTGQISASMLADIGCASVLIGHSERRHGLAESDALLSRKLTRALDASLIPILCVGETLLQRDSGDAHAIIQSQLRGSLAGHDEIALTQLIVAYEPVWAIGTGRTATPDDAAHMHRTVRQTLEDLYSARFAQRVRVIYGGSVNAKNAAELFSCEEIDGGLIGGASLNATDFGAIMTAAAARVGQ